MPPSAVRRLLQVAGAQLQPIPYACVFKLKLVSLRLKELIHVKSVSLGSSFHILTTRTITEKIFSNISKTTSYKQFVWMTPSCSTNGQVEIIFRSEGGKPE